MDVGPWKLDVGLWAVDIGTLDVGRSYVSRWMLSAASTRWTLAVGTFGHSDVGLDVERERDVGRWMFDSARSTLQVVRSYVGRGWT